MIGRPMRAHGAAIRVRLLPLVALALTLTLSLTLAAAPASAGGSGDLSGTWDCCGSGGAAGQVWEIDGSGGVGKLPDGTVFARIKASGGAPGGRVTIVTTYNGFAPGYVATFVGTLSEDADTITGTWSSNQSQSGTFTATRRSDVVKVSGRVDQVVCGETCRLVGLAGVQIRATGGPGGPASATSKSDGSYVIKVRKGTWDLVPQLRKRKFDPASRTIVLKGDRSGVNFRTGCPPADDDVSAQALATAAAERTFKGTTVGLCPDQTFVMKLRADGKVQIVTWSFKPVCTSVSGQVYIAKEVTLTGDETDSARPDPRKNGEYFIAFRGTFGKGHVSGRLLRSGELMINDARFERAPDTQPPSGTCPPVTLRAGLYLKEI